MELPEELANRPPRKPSQKASATLTIDAYRRLREELDDLTTRGRADAAERLRIAREHGDLRENADYDAAKNHQGLMEARIRKIEAIIRDPDIVASPTTSDEVGPGMLVTVRPVDEAGAADEVYLLAASGEERAPGVRTITTSSPFGSALLGARGGQEVSYQAPAGTVRYLVVGFEPHA